MNENLLSSSDCIGAQKTIMQSDTNFNRRRISKPQLEILVQYMERYPPLALASSRSREGRGQRQHMWEKIARTLNRVDEKQTKNGHSWHRYWLDLKFKVRRKYSMMRKCQIEGTHNTSLLSPLEQRVVKILTDEKGNLFPVGSIYNQILQYPLKGNVNTAKQMPDITKDTVDVITVNDVTEDPFITSENDHLPEQIILPQSDIKPNIRLKQDNEDPIRIFEKKSIEELRRELVELELRRERELFEIELRRQRELFEMEKKHRIEKHEMEMSILKIRKQIMLEQLIK